MAQHELAYKSEQPAKAIKDWNDGSGAGRPQTKKDLRFARMISTSCGSGSLGRRMRK